MRRTRIRRWVFLSLAWMPWVLLCALCDIMIAQDSQAQSKPAARAGGVPSGDIASLNERFSAFGLDFDASPDAPPSMEDLLALEESYVFQVSYGFLTLANVDVNLAREGEYRGYPAYRLVMGITSNPNIPFVGDKRVLYTSLFYFDGELHRDMRFWRDDLHDGDMERYLVEFDRDNDLVYFSERGVALDTLPLVQPAIGGSLIFYFSRMFPGLTTPYHINVFVENERADLTAVSNPYVEYRRYEAFPDPVPSYLSTGTTNVKGPFGFSGNFKSWFAADRTRIPLEAWVDIYLGHVKVKLIDYERRN